MFFFLAKLGWSLLAPTTFLIGLLAVGLILMALKRRAAGMAVAGGALLILGVCAFAPVGDWLLAPLEDRFPPAGNKGPVAGVIVLGGATSIPGGAHGPRPQPSEAGDRLFEAARLAKSYPAARIIVSGGRAVPTAAAPEADVMSAFLVQLGVDPARIEREGRSRDTFENAQFSRLVANPKPGEHWLLVTSAFHMPRAVGCFRKAGFDVWAAPSDWRQSAKAPPFSLSASANLARVDLAAKEYLGLFSYALAGRTSELLPKP